jgi:hypothetical protein
MKLRFFPLSVALAAPLALALTHSTDAAACGGCVVPAQENTVVTGHRMALSISTKQTVLWDQIAYAGDPESFGWLLPVKPGAVIELSTDAWFETLDATTSATIVAPNVNCGSSGPSLGCGALAGASDEFGSAGSGGGVAVLHRGTVGPYETVTLSTEQPGALNQWLDKHGYQLDPSTQPVVDAYVQEKFDFIALKLQPGKDVKEMKPVRVVQPGVSPALPLRMVAVGTGANVAITLFIIGEGRWEAANFSNAQIPVDLLAWDFSSSSSNYGALREKLLAGNAGATWMAAFAQPEALLSPLPTIAGFGGQRFYSNGDFSSQVDTIAKAYVQRGVNNGETMTSDCTAAFDEIANSKAMVVDPCPAGKPADDPSCASPDPSAINAQKLKCGALDDVAVALNGLHPSDVWLTRLEANLPRAALAQDLLVQAAVKQTKVDNEMRATIAQNADAFCGSAAAALPDEKKGEGGGPGRGPLVVTIGMAMTALFAFTRRRQKHVAA